jgi:hypothetical protein
MPLSPPPPPNRHPPPPKPQPMTPSNPNTPQGADCYNIKQHAKCSRDPDCVWCQNRWSMSKGNDGVCSAAAHRTELPKWAYKCVLSPSVLRLVARLFGSVNCVAGVCVVCCFHYQLFELPPSCLAISVETNPLKPLPNQTETINDQVRRAHQHPPAHAGPHP